MELWKDEKTWSDESGPNGSIVFRVFMLYSLNVHGVHLSIG